MTYQFMIPSAPTVALNLAVIASRLPGPADAARFHLLSVASALGLNAAGSIDAAKRAAADGVACLTQADHNGGRPEAWLLCAVALLLDGLADLPLEIESSPPMHRDFIVQRLREAGPAGLTAAELLGRCTEAYATKRIGELRRAGWQIDTPPVSVWKAGWTSKATVRYVLVEASKKAKSSTTGA